MVRSFLLSVCFLASLALPTAASASARVQLVLDGSGSMWGRIGGQTKMDIARSAVDELVSRWQDGTELGLTVYGHREKGDCQDIETLIPAGPADARAFSDAIRSVSPRGKTPLGDAVRSAARELRHHEDPAAVVLVSDGLETCGVDPCAVASELEASGIDFTIHVVGFDLAQEEGQALRCMAENTGGRFWLARDAAGLSAAFTEVAETMATPPPPPAPAPRAEPRPAFEGVRLVPYWSDAGEEIAGGVAWTVMAPEPDFDGKHDTRATEWNQGAITVALAPGRHLVRAKIGDAQRDQIIDVARGNGERFDIVLDAARVRVSAGLAQGSAPLSAVSWRVVGERDFDGNEKQVATQWNAPPDHLLILPAGTHTLVATHGDATARQPLTVGAGEKARVEVPLNAAQLRVSAALQADGAPVSAVSWKLLAPEADFEGRREHVALQWNAAPDHLFTVPAGAYELLAEHGEVSRSTRIEVAPGEQRRLTIDLDAARIEVSLLPRSGLAALGSVTWTVFDANGAPLATMWNAPPAHRFTLPAGPIRVVGTREGLEGAVETVIRPGEERALAVDASPKG